MEQNKVDLSKAKAGDTVVFRCGGKAVIKDIKLFQSMPLYDVSFDGYNDSAGYDNNGSRTWSGGYSLMDITEVIPAPVAFDWKDAKWGDAFKVDMFDNGNERVAVYVGKSPNKGFVVCKVDQENGSYTYAEVMPHELTRAPEHDIKEGV